MKSFHIKFPRRVRIHGGECGAVARALHHEAHEGALTQVEQTLISDEKAFLSQAEREKASHSTLIERKQMSTKTSFKRIALVAVSALGFGLLSVAPSQAAVNWIVVGKATEDDGVALAASKYTASKVLSANGISAFSVVAASSVEIQLLADDDLVAASGYKVSMTGFGVIKSGTLAGGDDNELLGGFTATSIPGTYPLVITVDEDNDFSTVGDQYSTNVVMTVTAPAAWSKTLSKSYIASGDGAAEVADADSDSLTASGSASKADENRGFVSLSFKDTANNPLASGVTVTAQITSGPGYLVMTNDNDTAAGTCAEAPTYSATVGRAISAFAADAANTLYICADGTAGKATIVISVTNQTVTTAAWSTKEFTFYGAVRSLSVAAANYTIGVAGGDTTGAAEGTITAANYVKNPIDDSTDVPAIIISAKDAAGQLATATAAPTVISSDITVVESGTCVLDDGSGAYSSGEGFGVYNCSFTTAGTAVSGQSATLTFRIADPLGTAGIDYLTTTQKVTVGGSRYKETLSLNKATYSAGEAMVVTRSAVDKSGNPVYDGATAPEVIFNKAIGGTATSVGANWYTNGTVSTSSTKPTVFAPSASGAFEARISGYNSSTSTSAIIVTATVGDTATDAAAAAAADAAAEAIDAANAATDAANLAAEAADAATVAAEEARDAADAATAAVEKLAADVATLMAALKAQITTLANTVAKIAKKVKA